jgi:[protein-PII] uridylyltransferase
LIFEKDKWLRTGENQGGLGGTLDLAAALKRAWMRPRDQTPRRQTAAPGEGRQCQLEFFTIIEVFTYDFPGLLYSISDALFRAELDIWVAKIATKVDQVVDVFYVRDLSGQKVDASERVRPSRRLAILEWLPQLE